MTIEIKNNTATIQLTSRKQLEKLIAFANENNLQHSIIVVKKAIFRSYVVKLYRCNKYSIHLMEMMFNESAK